MPISFSYQQILSKIHYDIERARCYVDSFPCSWMFWGVFGCFEVYLDVLGCFWMFLPGRPLSRLPCILLGCSRSNTSNSRTPARLVRSHLEPEKMILVIW